MTTPPSFNRIGYGHSDRVKRTVRNEVREAGLLQRPASGAEGARARACSRDAKSVRDRKWRERVESTEVEEEYIIPSVSCAL